MGGTSSDVGANMQTLYVDSCKFTIVSVERAVFDHPGEKSSSVNILVNGTSIYSGSGKNNSGTTNVNQTFSISNNSTIIFKLWGNNYSTNQYEYVNYIIA